MHFRVLAFSARSFRAFMGTWRLRRVSCGRVDVMRTMSGAWLGVRVRFVGMGGGSSAGTRGGALGSGARAIAGVIMWSRRGWSRMSWWW